MVNRDSERIPLSVAEREKLDKIYDYYGASGVIDKVDKYLFDKPLLLIGEDGANLLLRSKPIAFIAKGEYWVNNHAHVLDTVGGLTLEYICTYINAINLSPYVTGTAQPKMNQEKMNSILVPIPPLEEQYRIVTQIEELLPYIDKYGKAEEHLTALNTTFPEALKKSILQEAVQGKLVPQNPDDEPASVLLERIRTEKQALIKAGKIKKDKHESVIVTRDKIPYEIIDGKERCIADEVPFELPESWCWCRLDMISSKITDGEHKTPKRVSDYCGYYLLSARNIVNNHLKLDNVDYVDEAEFEIISKRCNPQKNDILISCSGSVGRCCVVEDDNKYVMVRSAAMVALIEAQSKWIMYTIHSDTVQEQIRNKTKTTAQSNLFQEAIRSIMIPLPPLAEQKRIVKKIEELMQYCEKL